MSNRYVISLNGVQTGKSIKEVAVNLSPIFKRSAEQIEKMLSSGIYEIKKGVDEKTAATYRTVIQNAGGLIEVTEEFEFTIDNLEQPKTKVHSVTASNLSSDAAKHKSSEAADNKPNQQKDAPSSNKFSQVETHSSSKAKKAIFAIGVASSLIVLSVLYKYTIAPKTAINTAGQASNSPSDVNATKNPISCLTIDTCFQAMLTSMSANNVNDLRTIAEKIDNFEKPARGNRTLARKLNDEGLKAFRDNDFSLASATFARAWQEDSSDAEVAANLGFARVKVNDFTGAKEALMGALKIDPRRTSTWVPIAELLAKSQPKTGAAVSALLIAYEWSSARQKAIDFYTSQGNSQTDPGLQNAYQEAVRKITLNSSSIANESPKSARSSGEVFEFVSKNLWTVWGGACDPRKELLGTYSPDGGQRLFQHGKLLQDMNRRNTSFEYSLDVPNGFKYRQIVRALDEPDLVVTNRTETITLISDTKMHVAFDELSLDLIQYDRDQTKRYEKKRSSHTETICNP